MQKQSSSIQVEPLGGPLGACMSGVDLRNTLDLADLTILRNALVEYQVLFFRGQDLSEEQHLAFAAQLGDLSIDPVARLKGVQKRISYIEDTADRPPAEFSWHTDLSWLSEPPALGILNALVVPAKGGDTIWVNLFAVYDALDLETKRRAQHLKLRHAPPSHYLETVRKYHGDEITHRLILEYPPVDHPLVRCHPLSGRSALFLSPLYAEALVGMPPEESASMLAAFHQFLENPQFQLQWHWQQYDVAIWDQASTNHRALGDHYPSHRRMRRCSVAGSRPVNGALEGEAPHLVGHGGLG